MAPYDVLGNVVLVKFARGVKLIEKKKFASKFLKEHRNVKTVLEKTNKISGRLRTPTSKWIAGEKTKEALYYENGCSFRLNVDSCYFSPRLAAERKEVADFVRKGENVLVMFGGVGPFAVVIAKTKKPSRVVTVELGRIPSKYAIENVKRNKLNDIIEVVQGDVRRKVSSKQKFDRIVMARPNLEDSFLDVAFRAIRKNGMVHYYGFYPEEDVNLLRELIVNEARKAGKKIKIVKVKEAGDIGARRFRYRVDIKVIN